jgi:hypothetical protein
MHAAQVTWCVVGVADQSLAYSRKTRLESSVRRASANAARVLHTNRSRFGVMLRSINATLCLWWYLSRYLSRYLSTYAEGLFLSWRFSSSLVPGRN